MNTSTFENVLTLIAGGGGLDDGIVARATDALKGLGGEAATPDWLSPGEAVDIYFRAAEPEEISRAVVDALGGAPVDFCCRPSEGRRKKLLVADMDCTIITTETLDELAGLAGKKAETAALTERAMRGEIEFPEALKQRVAMLAGLAETMLTETLAAITLSPGAGTLVRTMAHHGAHTVLVSGGFEDFTGPVADRCGFAENNANRFEISGGRLTGRVIEPIVDKWAKLETLRRLAEEKGIPLSATLAIGDGANDVPMIEAAGLGLAYKAKPVARDAAKDAGGAVIEHTDLACALFMQGYRRDEFILY